MTPEDYVSYPVALALKKAGFDWKCRDFYWTSDGVFKHTDALVHKNSEHCTTMVAAPTLAVAQKWLREKHHLHVNISTDGERSWTTNINGWNKEDIPVGYLHPVNVQTYDTYEQALSAGIAAAFELIKKGE